jgi:hypothetical protein
MDFACGVTNTGAGNGSTIILMFSAAPMQVPTDGVTTYVIVIGAAVLFVNGSSM